MKIASFEYSKNMKAIKSRIRRLPKLVNNAMDAQTKKDVKNVIIEFQNGIRRNDFGLKQLSGVTIQNKADAGMTKPNTPLYGEGDSQRNSLINALSFRKIKNGYRLYRRRAKHHKADLPLNVLLAIHENGAIIKVTERMRAFLHYIGIHLRRETLVVRIPPRPVVDKAIIRMLQKKKTKDPDKMIQEAINQLIRTGKESMFNKLKED